MNACDADRCKVSCGWVWGIGIFGFGKDPLVGIHNGLHFGSGVGTLARDGVAVERVVDGGQVFWGDPHDACCGISLKAGGGG